MKQVYSYNDEGLFTQITNCQLDPLVSKMEGKEVYIMPANSTEIPVLPEKENNDRKFDKDKNEWVYVEKPVEKLPEPYVPTEKDKLNEELWKVKNELDSLDYIGVKIATGRATREEYATQIARMTELAEIINEIENKLAELEKVV